MDIGNKIIELRKKEKLSQENLANKLGVTRNTISNWELNITKPDVVQIKKISKIFNVSIDELLDNDIRDIIEKRLSNTEKITSKNNKIIKIVCITMYVIILSILVGIMIYYGTKRDFTDAYGLLYICNLEKEDNKYGFPIGTYYIRKHMEKDLSYSIVVEFKQPGEEYFNDIDREYITLGNHLFDKINVGTSLLLIEDTYNYVKDKLLSAGAVCLNGYNE